MKYFYKCHFTCHNMCLISLPLPFPYFSFLVLSFHLRREFCQLQHWDASLVALSLCVCEFPSGVGLHFVLNATLYLLTVLVCSSRYPHRIWIRSLPSPHSIPHHCSLHQLTILVRYCGDWAPRVHTCWPACRSAAPRLRGSHTPAARHQFLQKLRIFTHTKIHV